MTPRSTNRRKIEHINVLNGDEAVDRRKHYFDSIRLIHRALPELDRAEVDPSVRFMDRTLSFPLVISSMTGGNHQLLETINRNLAIAAQQTGVAMGVGSQRVMFTDARAVDSFRVREYAPDALLFANIGAIQLNYGYDVDHCRRAIQTVEADALYLHLNPLQELIQPEGNTNFAGIGKKIAEVANELQHPVVVKEVGAGISVADVELLIQGGIEYIDVAGSGGTSWSRIESRRSNPDASELDLGVVFQDWGIPTPIALQQLEPLRDQITLIASGGIRNGVDMAKAVILGASMCGIASPFVRPAMESADAVVSVIERLRLEFITTMFLLGSRNISDLFANSKLILTSGPS